MPEAATAQARTTVRDALAGATARLVRAGCDTPRLDAEVLLACVLGVGRERLVIDAGGEVQPLALQRFRELLSRREAREPVAYLTGERAFRRLVLGVDRRVLIPRPETELLVEAALALPSGAFVVDVGTGSGAVALALKDERPDLRVLGVDVSVDAVALAQENAARLGLQVAFAYGDLLAPVSCAPDGVVANLPYVVPGDAALPPEITRYEPALALYGGGDGLEVVRRLVAELGDVPFVALEVGAGQASAVAELLVAGGFGAVDRRRDLAGHERVVVAQR